MIDLHRILLVAKREWWSRARQRSFQITTIVQVLFVILGGAAPVIIGRFADSDDAERVATVLVLDQTGSDYVARIAPSLAAKTDDGSIEATATDLSEVDLRTQVDDGDIDAALIVGNGENGSLSFTLINDDGESNSVAQRVLGVVAATNLSDNLVAQGIDPDIVEQAATPPAMTIARADGGASDGDEEFSPTKIIISYFVTIVMFMAIMLYGTWIAQGVVEEKSSRIMEIIINAATPRDLLIGKVLGIGAAAMTQLLPMLLAGGLMFGLQKPLARMLDVSTSSLPDLDFGTLSTTVVLWFLVYFIFGFTLYAALYAALGSLVSRQEEVNQATSPMTTVMMVGYFAGFFTMYMPDSLVSRVLSIIPFTSPFVMVARTVNTDVPAWELALSVLLLAGTTVAALLMAARIYRTGVLLYGQKPKFTALFKGGLTSTAR